MQQLAKEAFALYNFRICELNIIMKIPPNAVEHTTLLILKFGWPLIGKWHFSKCSN